MSAADGLGPLPEADYGFYGLPMYSPAKTRAYAAAQLAAERERCAAILRAWGTATWQPNDVRDAADQMLKEVLGPNVRVDLETTA